MFLAGRAQDLPKTNQVQDKTPRNQLRIRRIFRRKGGGGSAGIVKVGRVGANKNVKLQKHQTKHFLSTILKSLQEDKLKREKERNGDKVRSERIRKEKEEKLAKLRKEGKEKNRRN